MTYTNPLGIFTTDQLEKLSESNLKSLKKEILLHFQLSDDPTIERNGVQYDKNQILSIFDDLQQNLNVHLNIFENKTLLSFLQNGELDFFDNKEVIDKVQRDYLYREKIDKHISEQLNHVTAKLVNNVTPESPKKLASILAYSKNMSNNLKDKAYNKAYLESKTHVDQLRKTYPSPFVASSMLIVQPKLDELIDPTFYDCFKHLPGAFQDIGFTYGVWCHNDIVNKAFQRDSNYTNFDRDSLSIIAKAMEIGCHVSKSEAFKENTREIKNYLASGQSSFKSTPYTQTKQKTASPNKQSSSKKQQPTYQRRKRHSNTGSPSGKTILTIVLVIFGTLRLLVGISKCTDNNSYNRGSRAGVTQEDLLRDIERRQARNARTTRKAKEALLQQYVGNDTTNWNPTLLRTEVVNKVIELDYEVDIFPSNYTDFSFLVPNNIKEKYFGETKDYVVKFTSKDFPKRSMSHRFRTVINHMERKNSVTLDQVRSETGSKLSMTTKRLLKNKSLKGSITKYTTTSKTPTSKVLFEIRDDIEIAPQVEEAGKLPTFAEEKFDRWDDYKISNVPDQMYKNIILNNFNQVAHKVLKKGNYYAIQTMATYTPTPLDNLGFKTSNIQEIKGHVRLDYISMEDDIATITLYGENFYIRYFISNDTKRMIGMNMCTMNQQINVVEVIEVFFD